jgi:probable HAF family extracellular repeat protein
MTYSIVNLGHLSGGNLSYAMAVSADGTTVTGYANTSTGGASQAFYWTSGSGMVGIGTVSGQTTAAGLALSANGSVIVGVSGTHGFRWTSGTGIVDLGVNNVPFCCSSDGSTVYGNNISTGQGFVWTSGSGVVAIPGPSGLYGAVWQLNGCSGDGITTVGYYFDGSGVTHACTRTSAGGFVTLANLPGGTSADNSVANGISSDGTVIFGSDQSVGEGIWTNGTPSLTATIAQNPQSNPGYAVGVWDHLSSNGSVIVASGYQALVSGSVPNLGLGNSSTFATGVNGDGSVLAGASFNASNVCYAVIWTSATPPPSQEATVAELFFAATSGFVDLTVPSNRRLFISAAGGAENLGANGQAPFGVVPAVFLTSNGTPSSFAANAGRGGAFAITGGSLTAGGSAPPGSSQTVTTEQVNSTGQGVLGDYASGNLYAFNPKTKLDNGVQRRWLRRWRALPGGNPSAKTFAALWVDMQTGAGVPEGTNPHVMLRWSDDGGHTWSDQRIESVGLLGVTAATVKFNRLGTTRRFAASDRIFELSSADQFMVAILDAGVDVT